MSNSRLFRWSGMAAVVAGILFVVIQLVHPADTLASVTTTTWAVVHYTTLLMLILFLVGITGIYSRQVAANGWLGLVGAIVLSLALLTTAAFAFVEAFVSPVLAATDPEFVEALLGLVRGTGSGLELGALAMMWSISGLLFPLGCLVLGLAIWRARILPRWASAVFAVGLPVSIAVVSVLPADLHRAGALPIGVGLAGMGYGLWVDRGRIEPTEAGNSE